MIESLGALFRRDLEKLRQEVLAYPDEADLWLVSDGIANSAGNLALHLAGNLRHYIGATLGGNGYVRNRHAEFHQKNVARAGILTEIELAIADIETTFKVISPTTLTDVYPLEVFGHPMITEFFLIHLHGHLNYHLGQINYHRRLLSHP